MTQQFTLPPHTLFYLSTPYFNSRLPTLPQHSSDHSTSTHFTSFHLISFYLNTLSLIFLQHTVPYRTSSQLTPTHFTSFYLNSLLIKHLTLFYLNTPYRISPQHTSLCLNTPSSSLCLETPRIATARHSYYRTSLFYLISYSAPSLPFDTLTCFSP